MNQFDDELVRFEAEGTTLLPASLEQGYIENDGARLWYAAYGTGSPLIMLHGGLGNSRNWGSQVPALVDNGYQVILMDSRGHGRSSNDSRPFSYHQMAEDVVALIDSLQIAQVPLVGWSDGACTSLVLASENPERVKGVFYFACNMDPSGVKEFVLTPRIERCLNRHKKDYAELSPTPDLFGVLMESVGLMQRTQPNYSAEDLAAIHVPVTIVHSENDEFIKREHAEYLAGTIPGAKFVFLSDVSHFAPIQRPDVFNTPLLQFLQNLA